MDLKTIMKKRASVRKYTGEAPTEEEIKEILEAAYLGPTFSFHDMHISVITNSELLKEAEENGERFNKMKLPNYMYNAPVWIIFSAKKHTENIPNTPYTADMANGNMYWTMGSIIQNMHLKATELGLAACPMNTTIVALEDVPALREKLGIPRTHTAIGSIVIGKTDYNFKERKINYESLPTIFIK